MNRNNNNDTSEASSRFRRIAGRLFAASFMFFLVKGLIWLAIGGIAVIGIL